jgi:hypothetical protein
MDSGVVGLTAVAWSDAWNAAAPEQGLRLTVDPARLLELLRGMPVARALLSDLQRAVSTGRSVELIVSPDRQVAEIAAGSGHYLLTPAARNSVLAALVARPQAAAIAARAPSAPAHGGDDSGADAVEHAPAPPPGILWESPSAARERAPSELIALPWLGQAATLEVRRDGAGGGSGAEARSEVVDATLHLQLPRLGRFDAHIRVCGHAVAVSIDCASTNEVEPQLAALQQRLSAQGLVSAHVGLAPARSTG